MNGLGKTPGVRTGLVIGIHKKELGFGQQVAAGLLPADIRIIQIDQGLPQQATFMGKAYYYDAFHREIYMQLHQQVKRRIDLMIDLHTGINEQGRCADIYCSDPNMLGYLKKELMTCRLKPADDFQSLHLFEIMPNASRARAGAKRFPACRTIIPRAVWQSDKYAYVGLEIYLPDAGIGREADWLYAAGLVKCIIKAKRKT